MVCDDIHQNHEILYTMVPPMIPHVWSLKYKGHNLMMSTRQETSNTYAPTLISTMVFTGTAIH